MKTDSPAFILRPGVVVKTDFELALVKALGAFECAVSGCYFHFCQAPFRTLKRKNRKKMSDPDSLFVVRKIMQLPFLSEWQIMLGAPYLRRESVVRGVKETWDSFEKTFLNGRIAIRSWCRQASEDRTNNVCEGFNSSFAKLFRSVTQRPSFGEMVKNICAVFEAGYRFAERRTGREAVQCTENAYIRSVLDQIKESRVPSDINQTLGVGKAKR